MKIRTLKTNNYLWVALIVAMLFTLWIQLPHILDPYALEEDLRSRFYLHRHTNPDLFPTVDLAELRAIEVLLVSRTFVIETSSPGFSLIYQIASNFISLALISKLLAFPLMFASVFYLYRIGKRLSDDGTALALSLTFTILILTSTSEISILSGLHRAFAVPLTLGLVYYLLEKQYRWALFILFLNGITYLPTFPVSVMTYAFCLIRLREKGQWEIKIQWRRLAELFVVMLIVVIVVAPTVLIQVDRAQEGIDSTATEEENLLDNPQYQAGGRRPLFVLFPFIGRGGLTTSAQDGLHLMILSLFVLLVLLLRRSNTTKPPPVLMKLLYACFLGYALAWLTILLTSSFLLYLPSRHSRVGLFLFLLIFVVINIQETLRIAVGWVMRKRQQLTWYLLPLVVIVVGLAFLLPDTDQNNQFDFRGPVVSGLLVGLTVLLITLVILVRRRRQQEYTAKVDEQVVLPSRLNWLIVGAVLFVASIFYVRFMGAELYSPDKNTIQLFEFVETLPVDTLIAGSPCALDSIPFYGKRTVLYSCERFQPDSQMILDSLRAYYASEGEQLFTFCQDYRVTHLVVDEATLEPEFIAEGDYFFEPYNSILADEIVGRRDFALNYVPEGQKLFQVGSVFVIPCDSFLADLSASG